MFLRGVNALELFEIAIQKIDNTLPEMTGNSAGQCSTRTLKIYSQKPQQWLEQQNLFINYQDAFPINC